MKKALAFLSISCVALAISYAFLSASPKKESSKVFHYYTTVADENHFPMLMGLIGSIHKTDFDHLDEIAIFDIGLTPQQKETLNKIEKTKVYDIEKTNPDLCKYFTTNAAGRTVRGWFAWKPVAIKQALDMFPYFLYMDSGFLVLNSPDNLFKHIQQNGYFLMEISPHYIEERITKPVLEGIVFKLPKEQQEFLLSKSAFMIDAGIQGISRDLYQNYVLPMYMNSFDLNLFADDGSSRMGFGGGRHDQTLCSIYAHLEKLNLNKQGWTQLNVDGKAVPFHIHSEPSELNDKTCIYHSRKDFEYGGERSQYIHWRYSPSNDQGKASAASTQEIKETKKKPKVSIITSVWNGDEFIEGFLAQITRQTIFSECELLLINANSPGHEEEIILKYKDKFPENIVYVRLEQDPGLYGVWNQGVLMAKADFITNANLDDRSNPTSFETLSKALEEDPSVDLVYSGYYITQIPNETFENNHYILATDPAEFSLQALTKCLPGPQPMWRKSLHDKAGLFNPTFASAGDWEMWLRAASRGVKFKKVPGISTLYYINPKGLSTDQNSEKVKQRNAETYSIYMTYNSLWRTPAPSENEGAKGVTGLEMLKSVQ